MCFGLEIGVAGAIALAGTALSTGAAVHAEQEKSKDREQEALNERDAAKQHAENLVRARRKRVGEARAATAASGTALDEFASINTDEIELLGGYDEQMTLLEGQRRGRSLTAGNRAAESAAAFNGIGSLMTTGYQVGWKGKKGP